ncbi:hypothetical protein D3C77_308170 [compost metagenome]
MTTCDRWLSVYSHRFSSRPDDRPVVHPFHRLKVAYPSDCPRALKMHEPRLPDVQLHQCPLVRAIDIGSSLLEDNPPFIWAVYIPRAKHGLPACLYAALWNNQIIIPVSLIYFRSFGNFAYVDNDAVIQQRLAVRAHAMNNNRTRADGAMSKISISVIVPERAGILPAGNALHFMKRTPGPGRILCSTHIQPLVRRTKIHIEQSVMVAERRRPASFGISPHFVIRRIDVQPFIYSSDNRPVDQILRMQHRHAHEMKIRAHHIEIIAHADDVRVGEIRIQHRIAIIAVAKISPCGHCHRSVHIHLISTP